MGKKQSKCCELKIVGFGGGTILIAALIAAMSIVVGCDQSAAPGDAPTSAADGEAGSESATGIQPAELAARALGIFGALPLNVPNPENLATEAKLDLGRMLYYDARLSKNHDISCNSCHLLDAYGVDGEPTSPGHRGPRGGRNSPTVYNAALHLAQFWDGREPDVEAQAKGPVLNPVEMAAPSADHVASVLNSIPGYVDAFNAAFPEQADAVSYDNMARAIGAFERNLMTPGRLDAFMEGDLAALDATERRGLETFLGVGCNSCHMGPAVGGTLYRKLGFIYPYETADLGREDVTGAALDRHVFKVPSLRNIAKTGPYFHDGSIVDLPEVVRLMGYHQLGQQLSDSQVSDIVAFLGALTGEIDLEYVAKPALPASGPNTPAPDPS
jgi:cytochrome c peroxidase